MGGEKELSQWDKTFFPWPKVAISAKKSSPAAPTHKPPRFFGGLNLCSKKSAMKTHSTDVVRIKAKASFAQKVRIFSRDYLRCCLYISSFDRSQFVFTKMLYSKLIATSQLLEDFLDFHGAKNSKGWYFYRELSASVRHLSLGGYSQKHVVNRLDFYHLEDTAEFRQKGFGALDFITDTLMRLAPLILDEARRLEIPIPDESFDPGDFPGVTTPNMLPYDIDDEDRDLQKKHIVNIASEFLSIADNFEQLGFYEPFGIEKIMEIVPDKINEVEIRRFEMLVHNLQSSFDTYVIHGGYRFGNRKLKQLRGYFFGGVPPAADDRTAVAFLRAAPA